MRYEVYANQVAVGWSELEWGDPPMGVARGIFHPYASYSTIEASIREYTSLIWGQTTDENQLAVVQETIAAMRLVVRAPDDNEIIPCIVVELVDVFDLEGETGREVSVLGIPYPTYSKYFSDHERHYREQFS